MIQNYPTLKNQVREINELIEKGAHIQKIYSSYGFITLQVRQVGLSYCIYLGRGAGFEGLWLSEDQIPADRRLRDRYLEYYRKHVRGNTFQGLRMDENDRCIELVSMKKGREERISVFYYGRRSYFAHQFYSEKKGLLVYKSWTSKYEEIPELISDFTHFDEVGRRDIDKSGEIKNYKLEESLILESKAYESTKGLKKKHKKIKRTISKIENDLNKAKGWNKLYEQADDEGLNEKNGKCVIEGIRFNFIGLSYYEKRNLVFSKAKRLKLACVMLEDRLKSFKEMTLTNENPIEYNIRPVSPSWKSAKPITRQNKKYSYKLFEHSKLRIGVGTSSQGNDELRNTWAHKNDRWYHLDSQSSAHVIVKTDSVISEEELELVAFLLMTFGKKEATEIDLIFTEVKNLKGVKGSPGTVLVKKEKRRRITLSAETISKFKPILNG